MTIRIETGRYVRAHGAEPKGRGRWGFVLETHDSGEELTVFAPACMSTLTSARAWVKKHVRCMGYQDAVVHVAP